MDILSDDPPTKKVGALFDLHRNALKRGTIGALWRQKAATAPSALANVLQSSPVVDAVRKEIRRRSKFNPDADDITAILRGHVIRSELLLP